MMKKRTTAGGKAFFSMSFSPEKSSRGFSMLPGGFAHAAPVERQHVRVHPVTCPTAVRVYLILGYLAFVVREFQVHATAVYVERFAQVFRAHGRAFHMPAGKSFAPGRGASALYGKATPFSTVRSRVASAFRSVRPARASLRAVRLCCVPTVRRTNLRRLGVRGCIFPRRNIPSRSIRMRIPCRVCPALCLFVRLCAPLPWVLSTVCGCPEDVVRSGNRPCNAELFPSVRGLRAALFSLFCPRPGRRRFQMSGIGDIAYITHFVTQKRKVSEHHVERYESAAVPRWTLELHGRAHTYMPTRPGTRVVNFSFRPEREFVYVKLVLFVRFHFSSVMVLMVVCVRFPFRYFRYAPMRCAAATGTECPVLSCGGIRGGLRLSRTSRRIRP